MEAELEMYFEETNSFMREQHFKLQKQSNNLLYLKPLLENSDTVFSKLFS